MRQRRKHRRKLAPGAGEIEADRNVTPNKRPVPEVAQEASIEALLGNAPGDVIGMQTAWSENLQVSQVGCIRCNIRQ